MLRFQQYIELVRTQDDHKLLEAIAHAKKYLLPSRETYPKEVQQAAGLLAFPPGGRPTVYNVSKSLSMIHIQSLIIAILSQDLYSESRWDELAKLFVETHNSLLSLPSAPLLHIALSAGLSALKTPSSEPR